ncbi:MAG: guanylate kinase [Candidatus Marinimicrobia bacterium]|nr:guanylate kinase [Candidatus Neomarinimicrobiota bacterium]|tara:strand:+ start:17392 stop:17973 length:582 start_codon:yes stop_codon:yes gene_type:complete
MQNSNKPLMLVLSSPSGAGKTTLSKKLQESDSKFQVSVSHTTRKARPNEVDGIDYHFVNKEKFKKLIDEKAFYEHAEIFGNYYGTSKNSIKKIIDEGCNVLFDIDWQGAEQLSNHKELNLLKIFILPPSIEELEKRLISRNQDDKEAIKRRLSAYQRDITHSKDYDHVITNDKVEKCFKQIKEIVLNHQKKGD